MWHLNKIPKILHLYWGISRPLSYLRYLTVETFKKYNPDWDVIVYYPSSTKIISPTWKTKENTESYVGKDYFYLLKDICNLVEVNFSDTVVDELHDVHKSDYLRWKVLSEHGGFWSDFDILYINKIDNLIANNIENASVDCLLCKDTLFHYFLIGFFGCSKNNLIISSCYKNSIELNPTMYQSIGSKLLKKEVNNSSWHNLDTSCVYPFSFRQVYMIPNSEFNFNNNNTIGVHWYAGSNTMKNLENSITPNNRSYGKFYVK